MKLTSNIIKNINNANAVIARYNGNLQTHSLELVFEDRKTGVETTFSMDVIGHIEHYRQLGDIARMDAVMLYAGLQESWETVRNIVRGDDDISLKWVIGNNSQTLDEAGLFHDICYLVIRRFDKHGNVSKRFYLPIVDQVSPNNSARMVKYQGGK